MDESIVHVAIWLRGLERLLIIVGGFVSIVLGGLLYKWGVFEKIGIKVGGGGENQTNGMAFSLRDASPGIVCCILGILLLVIGMRQSLEIGLPTIEDGGRITFSGGEQNAVKSVLKQIVTYKDSPPSPEEFANIRSSAEAVLNQLKD